MMTDEAHTGVNNEDSGRPARLARALVGFAIYLFLAPAVLFVAAGTLDWPMAWVYVGLLLAATLGSRLVVWKRNPDTLRERARYAEADGALPQDRLLVLIVAVFGPLAIALVGGLSHRFGWPPAVSPLVQYLGLAGLVVGYGLGVWAMIANAFFSAVARLQEDRGQQVVTGGPYRIVRHPAYAGALLVAVAWPLMLGSVWAVLPGLGIIAGVVIRTWREDRMLLDGLSGYAEYAGKTGYRLLPGIW
jgi:protein-S-isoprenylcysteine O-methyltransferase Ste14